MFARFLLHGDGAVEVHPYNDPHPIKEKKMTTTKKPAPKKITILDFTAPWCGPCQALKPVLAKFAAAHPEVKVTPVNIDKIGIQGCKKMCKKFGISEVQGVPTLIWLVNGKVAVDSRDGGAKDARGLAGLNKIAEGL